VIFFRYISYIVTSFQIREKFLNFFKNKNHTVLPSSSLIPKNDPSLLFINAGMNPFKNIFLGLESPEHLNVTTIQKCLRAGGKHNDIENVGETPWHHTFFEMLGNFSFGNYFKKQSIEFAWDFLVNELHLKKQHLWVSVFKDDETSYEIWKDHILIPEHKIFKLGKESNFWQMGDVGPCGPCSEIHYYDGLKSNPHPEELVEIWNLVFMEFYDTENHKRHRLPKPCVDTGMGLERLCSVIQNTTSNYQNDLFKSIIQTLESYTSVKYNFLEHQTTEKQMAFRVIADHSRAVSFLINDGILPSNEGSHYVLRRLIRRALYYSHRLSPKVPLLEKATEQVVQLMSSVYPTLKQNQSLILSCISEETERFSKSLEKGRKKLIQTIKKTDDAFVDFKMAWDLYSTYGFPIDLTRLIVKENNYKMIDEATFEKEKSLLEKQLYKHNPTQNTPLDTIIKNCKSIRSQKNTRFIGYETNQTKASILYLFHNNQEVQSLNSYQEGWLITDQTCFYPEGGGPIGDQGSIRTPTGEAQILDTLKRNQIIFHKIKIKKGILNQGSECDLQVNLKFRFLIATSHSATHLLHASLRKHLGDKVRQAGSLVEPGYLRFDFTHNQILTPQELTKIETDICAHIQKQEEVSSHILPYKQALKEGALTLQGENYEQMVRVIRMGAETSNELCGGIHVKNLKEIEDFKIISETGVQSGVRRILASTASVAYKWEEDLKNQIVELSHFLKLPQTALEQKDNPFFSWEFQYHQKIEQLQKQIVCLDFSMPLSKKVSKNIYPNLSHPRRHPLALWNLELRNHLNLPVPKVIESVNPFLEWVQKKQKQFEELNNQYKKIQSLKINTKDLLKKATKFNKGQLIITHLPLKDRKLLANITDHLKSKISSGVLITIGEDDTSCPIIVTITKNLQKDLSAHKLLKNILSPFLKGKGGGQKHFAQGSVTDTSKFSKLEAFVLKNLHMS